MDNPNTSLKSGKPKIASSATNDINGDFEESDIFVNSSRTSRTQKRARNATTEEDEFSKIIDLYSVKIKKEPTCVDDSTHESKLSRQKLLEAMYHQSMSRNKCKTKLLKSLSELVMHLGAEHETLLDNEKKMEHVAGALVKCIKQATTSHKQKLEALKDICTEYNKANEEMEKKHKAEAETLANKMEKDMSKLQQKLVAETKRKQIENMCKTILQFQNDF